MFSPRAMIEAAVGYVRKNPDEVVRAAVNATGGRFGVPLATLRWFAGQLTGAKAPKDDEVTITDESIRVGVRLRDVKLALVGESESPVATLIKSGALDLSKPGNLVKFIPKRPPAVVEAEGDRVVIDLMKVPKLANDKRLKRFISILA